MHVFLTYRLLHAIKFDLLIKAFINAYFNQFFYTVNMFKSSSELFCKYLLPNGKLSLVQIKLLKYIKSKFLMTLNVLAQVP